MSETGAGSGATARTMILAATITASSMVFVDGTVVNIALPAIQTGLAAGFDDLQWVSNAYLLLLGALILVGGGLGDRVGRRRIFIVGIAAFTVASVLCAAAPTIGILIAARSLQSIGAALLVPQSLAIISATFPKEVRGRAIGTWAAASSITTSIGPPLGGFLVDLLSWRAAFWINLPLSAVSLWLTWRFVPESRDETVRGPVDWAGALVAIVSFGALTYGLIAISDEGASATVITAVLLGLVGLAIFVAVEARAANPVMPLELFRSPVFAGTNIVTVFLYGALAGFLFLLPFDLQARRGLTAGEAGFTILPVGIIIGVLSRYTGGLSDRLGPRPFLMVGPVLVGLCCVGLALHLDDYWVGVLIPVLLLSIGMAIVVSPLTTAVMNSVPDTHSGAASGVNNAASRLAGVIAIAIFGAAASIVFGRYAPDGARFGALPEVSDAARAATEGAFLSAYRAAMLIAAAWCFLAAAGSWLSLPAKPSAAGSAP